MDQATAIIESHFAARAAQATEDVCSPTELARLAIERLQTVFGVAAGPDARDRYASTFELLRNLVTITDGAAHLVAALYDGQHGIDVSALPLEARDSLKGLCRDLDAVGALAPYHREDGGIGV